MGAMLDDGDAELLRRWARRYRRRWPGYALIGVLAPMSAAGGLWILAQTVSMGRGLGLTASQTLLGSSLVAPAIRFLLLAMATGAYLMLLNALYLTAALMLIRKDARRYRIVLKLLPPNADAKDGAKLEIGMWKMAATLNDGDAAVLRRWARCYRRRWAAYAAFGVFALMPGAGGLWILAQAISLARRLGLTASQSLLGLSLVDPAIGFTLFAMEWGSYAMLINALYLTAALMVIRNEARKYRIVLKLLPRDVDAKDGAKPDK